MRFNLVKHSIAIERILPCILLTAALFASGPLYANCAAQVINEPPVHIMNNEFEETLQLAFQNQLLFTISGQKPFVLITDYGALPNREFFERLEGYRERFRPGHANVEWLFSKGPWNAERGRPNDWIFFYNRKGLDRLFQNPEAMDNFARAGVKFITPQDAIDYMIKRFGNREVTGVKLTYKDDLILGTLLGYPPSDVLAYANRREGARNFNWMMEDREGHPYYIATFRTYLPSEAPFFEQLRVQSHAAMIWFTAQRRAGRSLLSILLGN